MKNILLAATLLLAFIISSFAPASEFRGQSEGTEFSISENSYDFSPSGLGDGCLELFVAWSIANWAYIDAYTAGHDGLAAYWGLIAPALWVALMYCITPQQ